MAFALLNKYILERFMGFPGGSVVKNLPAHAGDMGLIPGPKNISHAVGQLSPSTTTPEPVL